MLKVQETEIKDLFKTDEGVFVFKRKPSEISDYQKKRRTFEQQEAEMTQMKGQINKVDAEISEIKMMLMQLLAAQKDAK